MRTTFGGWTASRWALLRQEVGSLSSGGEKQNRDEEEVTLHRDPYGSKLRPAVTTAGAVTLRVVIRLRETLMGRRRSPSRVVELPGFWESPAAELPEHLGLRLPQFSELGADVVRVPLEAGQALLNTPGSGVHSPNAAACAECATRRWQSQWSQWLRFWRRQKSKPSANPLSCGSMRTVPLMST